MGRMAGTETHAFYPLMDNLERKRKADAVDNEEEARKLQVTEDAVRQYTQITNDAAYHKVRSPCLIRFERLTWSDSQTN